MFVFNVGLLTAIGSDPSRSAQLVQLSSSTCQIMGFSQEHRAVYTSRGCCEAHRVVRKPCLGGRSRIRTYSRRCDFWRICLQNKRIDTCSPFSLAQEPLLAFARAKTGHSPGAKSLWAGAEEAGHSLYWSPVGVLYVRQMTSTARLAVRSERSLGFGGGWGGVAARAGLPLELFLGLTLNGCHRYNASTYRYKTCTTIFTRVASCPNYRCLGAWIAVGIRVAPAPPHRSVREELPHTAPTSSGGVTARVAGRTDGKMRQSVRPAPRGARGNVRTTRRSDFVFGAWLPGQALRWRHPPAWSRTCKVGPQWRCSALFRIYCPAIFASAIQPEP
jgi:hypothetical protein